jgi:hypothetical protein
MRRSTDRHVDFTPPIAPFQVSLVSIESGTAVTDEFLYPLESLQLVSQPFEVPPGPYKLEKYSLN